MATPGPTPPVIDKSTITDAETLGKILRDNTKSLADSNAISTKITDDFNKMKEVIKTITNLEEKSKAINATKEAQQQRLNKLKELQFTMEQLDAVQNALDVNAAVVLTGEAEKFAQQQKTNYHLVYTLIAKQ